MLSERSYFLEKETRNANASPWQLLTKRTRFLGFCEAFIFHQFVIHLAVFFVSTSFLLGGVERKKVFENLGFVKAHGL